VTRLLQEEAKVNGATGVPTRRPGIFKSVGE